MCPTGIALPQDANTVAKSSLRSAFDVLDADGDGKISCEDLRAFYRGFPVVDPSEEEMFQTMITVADSNRDGFVEYEEFEKVLGARKGRDGRIGVMEDAFRAMDKDGDGKLGHEDLMSHLNWAGLEVDDEDVRAMIRLGSGDENGGVTFQGFLKIWAV